MNKIIFYLVWLAVLFIGPYTVLSNTPLKFALQDQTVLINLFQRMLGLMAFSLVFSQVALGSFMGKLTQKLGGWIYTFHITEGIFAYLFILAHPLMMVFLNYQMLGSFDPFYVYTDVCLLCKPLMEYYYTFGRVSLWFLTIGIIVGKFRTHPWLRVHWLKFHLLNYLAFILIALHAWYVGSDVRSAPFSWFFWTASLLVSGIIFYKVFSPLAARLRKKAWVI